MGVKGKRDYRNRLGHIIDFWREHYPEYNAVGVRDITAEELENPALFWWKNKHDIVYEGLNVKMVKAFLADKKTKSNGRTSSHSQLRKYNDAILWGAKSIRNALPISYYQEMEVFLSAFKNETAVAKKDGMLDEREADPIPRPLFRLRSLAESNLFVWVFTILQWNCVARSINIHYTALKLVKTI